MLAFLNILYLLLPINQTGNEVGINFISGSNLEHTSLKSVENQDFFYNENDFQIGFHYGLGAYYNYYFERDYYIGLKATYKHKNTTFLEYEPEIINIDGQAVDGEFEHYFDYNLESINIFLNSGYRLNHLFNLELGLLYALPISDYQIQSKETIVKPVDAGVFKKEGTRIRNEQSYTIPSISSKFGTFIGLNGLFPMNKSETVFLKPSISYSYLFSDNLENLTSWKTDFIDLSVGVSFIIGENDIFVVQNKIVEPLIDIVSFKLDGTIENPLNNLEISYVESKGLQSTADKKMVVKSNFPMVLYVGIKELRNREATFFVKSNEQELYRIDNLEKSNRFEINVNNIVKSINQKELEFFVDIDGEFYKSQSVNVEYNETGKINYLLGKTANEVIDYMNSNNTQKFKLYTNDKNIYSILLDYNISNLTIKSKDNFPYHFDEFDNSYYILIVE